MAIAPARVICRGFASFKQDGPFSTWNKRFLLLREDELSWHRNDSTPAPMGIIKISDIDEVCRSDVKDHCFLIRRAFALARKYSLSGAHAYRRGHQWTAARSIGST